MPGDYVVPNFAGWLVSAAQNHTTGAGVGLRVSSRPEEPYHVPDSSELPLTISGNAANSPAGTTKGVGEWVGVDLPS